MYSSTEIPSPSSNAFNMQTTAKAISKAEAVAKNGSVKSITTPSTKHSAVTIFTNTNRNKFSYGAYNSNYINNNNENISYKKTSSVINSKIVPRGPYLQYKMSEKDNNSNNYKTSTFYYQSTGVLNNAETLRNEFIDRGVLPRAKISSNSVLDDSGVDYNLKTQTIGRYRPQQLEVFLKKSSQHEVPQFVQPLSHANMRQKMAFSCHTLPITRKETEQKTAIAPQNNLNYITLRNALNVKAFHQLTPTQGWAVLCQSVQALQDLFLSETSVNRVLPVVSPRNLLITSRGRVVYGLLTIDKYNEGLNEYLSDEFRQQFIDIRHASVPSYTESDIEKMWIFSLGRTLNKTMPTILPQTTTGRSAHQQQHHSSIVLQATIWKMCNSNVDERATLMFLLNIISDYCKNVHQAKPFSHIVMDLFKKVVHDPVFLQLSPKEETQENNQKTKQPSMNDGHKSDTDSGRSSDYRSDDNSLQKKLPSMKEEDIRYFSLPRPKYIPTLEKTETVEIPKIKKRVDVENFRQKRVGGRRFTVDVAINEVEAAIIELGNRKASSRSSNNLNTLVDNEMKLRTLPHIKLSNNDCIIEEDESEKPIGPEFIVNSNSDMKILVISGNKDTTGIVNVLLLNGKRFNVICNPVVTTSRMVFEAIIRKEQIHENYILGLCALIGGDFVFLPLDLKIYKVAPQVWIQSSTRKSNEASPSSIFSLYLRVKLFLPTMRIISLESRHVMYLQLRKSVLENQIICTDDDLITLGGLALQAEVGDFKEEMKYIEYFTISHYLPDGIYQQNKELAKYLRNSHYSKRGLHPKEAELNFIRYLQEMREYGIHHISGIWMRDDKIELNVYIGIGLNGIKLFERSSSNVGQVNRIREQRKCHKRLTYDEFDWLEIENICFSKQVLCIVVHRSNAKLNLNSKDKSRIKFKLKMDSRKSFFAFNIASEQHKFYLKLRNSFVSIKSIADEFNISLPNEEHLVGNGPEFNIKIGKPTKSTVLRVRNLKKSMLNDGRLMKIKERFLKRSKSTVCDFKRTVEEISNDNNQNKENEHPQFPSMMDLSIKSPTITRNKVKMGTRVFSASYLNKSFDSLDDNQTELLRVDSWGALCIHSPSEEAFEVDDGKKEAIDFASDRDDAYVVHSSIKSVKTGMHNYSLPNDTMSQSLLEKFDNISCSNDRVLSEISIIKDPVFSDKFNYKSQSLRNLVSINIDNFIASYTMGISIIQGQSDNYVYVKELVKNGPGDRNGICVGDQIVSVDGMSLFNLPYSEALQILQQTGKTVKLIVSQSIYRKPLKYRNVTSNDERTCVPTPVKETPFQSNLVSSPSRSLPNLINSKEFQIPKIVTTISKENIPNQVKKPPRSMGQSRKYLGPTKYPVTPAKDLKLTISPNAQKSHLSLPTNDSDSLII